MVRQANAKGIFTDVDQPRRTVPMVLDEPRAGHGQASIDGAYPPPLHVSALDLRAGEAGITVCTVITWLRFDRRERDAAVSASTPLLRN